MSKYDELLTLVSEATKEEYKSDVVDQKVIKEYRKQLNDIMKADDEANSKADKLAETWNYNEAINLLKKVNKDAESLYAKIKKISDDKDIKLMIASVDSVIDSNKKKISELSKKNVKKQLNRFDNRYWIKYTKEHNKAFRETEKELLGYNTKAGKNHDMDKYIMYHFLPAPIAHALHTQFASHHKRRAKTKDDYVQMMIDLESNRKTKPDKQMKPYEVIDKFYPDLKDTMIPILKEHGLPTNAAEDREYEKKKAKEKKVVKESVNDMKLYIYEYENIGLLSTDECNYLLEAVNLLN